MDSDEKLMLEIFKAQVREQLEPHHLAHQFVLTYELAPGDRLGVPMMNDQLAEYASSFLKRHGFEEYDRKKFFSTFRHYGIKSSKIKIKGVEKRMYLINPLHKLEE